MIPLNGLILFALAALVLVLTPGPNMIYLISRSVTQGHKAGMYSLLGAVTAIVFHTVMISLGLTAVLASIPYAFTALKIAGVVYLLYLAWQAVGSGNKNIFVPQAELKSRRPGRLFTMGLFTNLLNPKTAIFYLLFFPQFIRPEWGSVLTQCLELGAVHMLLSFAINAVIILMAARIGSWFGRHPKWVKAQQWLMGGVLAGLAVRMAFSKAR